MSEEIKSESAVVAEATNVINKKMNDKEITKALEEKVDSIKDEDTKILAELLLELKKSQDVESNNAKKHLVLSTITSILSIGLVVVVMLILMPRIIGLLNSVNTVLDSTTQIVAEAESVITNLQKTTDEVAKTDIAGMMNNINDLVSSSQVTIEEAMGKMLSIDIDSLNGAINDLASVVAPLSKLFGGR